MLSESKRVHQRYSVDNGNFERLHQAEEKVICFELLVLDLGSFFRNRFSVFSWSKNFVEMYLFSLLVGVWFCLAAFLGTVLSVLLAMQTW